jgi:hypothetical protein
MFVIGMITGLLFGASVTATALAVAPRIVGGSGYLMGYTVKNDDGDEVCDDPFVWTATKEIECD